MWLQWHDFNDDRAIFRDIIIISMTSLTTVGRSFLQGLQQGGDGLQHSCDFSQARSATAHTTYLTTCGQLRHTSHAYLAIRICTGSLSMSHRYFKLHEVCQSVTVKLQGVCHCVTVTLSSKRSVSISLSLLLQVTVTVSHWRSVSVNVSLLLSVTGVCQCECVTVTVSHRGSVSVNVSLLL